MAHHISGCHTPLGRVDGMEWLNSIARIFPFQYKPCSCHGSLPLQNWTNWDGPGIIKVGTVNLECRASALRENFHTLKKTLTARKNSEGGKNPNRKYPSTEVNTSNQIAMHASLDNWLVYPSSSQSHNGRMDIDGRTHRYLGRRENNLKMHD